MSASPASGRDWSLGAVLAERRIDSLTYLLIVRADLGLAASMDLRRRLLELRLAGHSTVLVDLEAGGHVSGPMMAALMQAAHQFAAREGRLVVASEQAAVRAALQRAGFDPVDGLENE
jgi:anti-anti-sigma regulatory factor